MARHAVLQIDCRFSQKRNQIVLEDVGPQCRDKRVFSGPRQASQGVWGASDGRLGAVCSLRLRAGKAPPPKPQVRSQVALGRAAAGGVRGGRPRGPPGGPGAVPSAGPARGGPPPEPLPGGVGPKRQQIKRSPPLLVNRSLEPRSLCLLFQENELISGRSGHGGASSLPLGEPGGFAGQAAARP